MALFWSLFTGGGSFLVGFLKNEILGFDENLAVVLTCNNVLCCNYRRSVCVRTAPGNFNMVAYIYGKTRALLRLVWPASRLTRTPLARRRWQGSIHQRDVTI